MKQLTCEMCGSTDLIKQDGVFVCQSCGCKYSVEEAKKMMIEGTVEVQGTVKLDSADEVNNLLLRAKQFEKEDKKDIALQYYNKVLDIDANNTVAKQKVKEYEHVYIGEKIVSEADITHIDDLMKQGLKIDAIKLVRKIADLGLLDAKTWVENYSKYDLRKPQKITTSISSDQTSGIPTKSSGACYIATCVYGSYDCPQVWTLRRYRDNTLGSTWYGRAFIHIYYAISPTLVKWFGKTKWFKKLWQHKLDKIVKRLQSQGVEDSPYNDKEW